MAKTGFIRMGIPKTGLFLKKGVLVDGNGTPMNISAVTVHATKELALKANKRQAKMLKEMYGGTLQTHVIGVEFIEAWEAWWKLTPPR